ncbi:MAG: endonuclease MutS2 [Candidatus Bipolaricaulis sp.]|nr:endonuclease MutS2 [Candidatus Bipolaricaulis sp.]
MAIADAKALRDLEFDRLKSIVRSHTSSPLGEEAVDALFPTVDRASIELGMAEVTEAISFLAKAGRFSLGGVRDLAPLLRRAREGSFLDGGEFLVVLETVDATLALRRSFEADDGHPRLVALAGRLTAGGDAVGHRIRGVIDERGAVRDDASDALATLVKKRRTVESRIETKLRSFIDGHADLISEPVVTRRQGRLVIAVRSGAVGMAEFVVHDRSATGQTLYAEPTALVAENNAAAQLSEEIRDEVRRILRELTGLLLEAEASFLRDRAVLGHLDGLFARAAYAAVDRCAFPRLGDRLSLRNARHPLLPRDRAVPVSLALGDGRRMTVITGPNTGGKTVTLKTLGLLTLMTQSAIPIPASADSEIRIVSSIRTDIGDEQSIEQSLSTFSAHMRNIVDVLAHADGASLILLDELGAGTDPQEGAALGLAVIEALLASGALVAISTHLTPLKYFAIRHPEIKTASMEFDVASLSPTFRVVEGVPGRSNALLIAERLGLPRELIERARASLTGGEIRAEDIIDELHRERQALSQQREGAERERAEARELREEYERRLRAFEREREASLSPRVRALETFLRDGQRRAEEVMAQIRSAQPAREDDAKAALRELTELRKQAEAEREALADLDRPVPIDPASLEVGMPVRVHSVRENGRIVQLDARGKVIVDLDGGIRVTTEAADLEQPRAVSGRRDEEARLRSTSIRRPRPSQVPLQIDLRGRTVSEALREVEDYLDQLLRADIRQAEILHGKGTGALRDAVRNYLSSCTFVTSFGYAPPNQGGDGVTVFQLSGDAASG